MGKGARARFRSVGMVAWAGGEYGGGEALRRGASLQTWARHMRPPRRIEGQDAMARYIGAESDCKRNELSRFTRNVRGVVESPDQCDDLKTCRPSMKCPVERGMECVSTGIARPTESTAKLL